MKFAKFVLRIAGVWGVIVLTPLYFMLCSTRSGGRIHLPSRIRSSSTALPAWAMAWQFAFFVIAMDPVRFRPMKIPAVLEKLSYVLTIGVLYLQKRMSLTQSIVLIPDGILCLLFTVAFFRVRRHREGA